MNLKIEARKREIGRKSALKNLRKDGFIPAVIYKAGENGTNILFSNIEFKKIYRQAVGEVAFYEITIDGKEITAVLKEKQIDPVTREFLHLDFVELLKGQEITLNVPLKFVGESIGVENGGIVDIIVRSIEVTCLPKDVPDNIKVDLTNIDIGGSVYAGDLDLAGVKADLSDDSAIVNVVAPMSEEEYEASLEADIEVDEEEVETLEEELAAEEAEAEGEAEETTETEESTEKETE